MGSSRFTAQDAAASAVSLILAVGVVACALLRIPTPDGLNAALGVAIGWLFTRSGAAAGVAATTNGVNH